MKTENLTMADVEENKRKKALAERQITKELHNGLVKRFNERAQAMGFIGKKRLQFQAEFFIGAVSVLDLLDKAEKSCITPSIYFPILRGEEIKEIE